MVIRSVEIHGASLGLIAWDSVRGWRAWAGCGRLSFLGVFESESQAEKAVRRWSA